MWYADLPDHAVVPFLNAAIEAAERNVENGGGPFGALIVDYRGHSGAAIVGRGVNRVIATNDPSNHAEVMALRDAATRLGYSDLSGLILITSCECCPMCLSAAIASGIEEIYFAATRHDAAQAGFSDEAQYRLMAAGLDAQAILITDEADCHLLGGHDAALVLHPGPRQQIFFGDCAASRDLAGLPALEAIRLACRDHGSFHLPEDTRLVTARTPHPLSLMAADWARIGRVRDAVRPDDPACDAQAKDTSRIRYLSEEWEEMPIFDQAGKSRSISLDRIWRQIKGSDSPGVEVRAVEGVNEMRLKPFEAWRKMVEAGGAVRY